MRKLLGYISLALLFCLSCGDGNLKNGMDMFDSDGAEVTDSIGIISQDSEQTDEYIDDVVEEDETLTDKTIIDETPDEDIPEEVVLPETPYEDTDAITDSAKISKKDYEGLPFDINFYYPQKQGKVPVMVFLGGMNGVAPDGIYTKLFGKLAAKGVLVLVPQGAMLLPNQYKKRAEDLAEIVTWMRKGNFSGAISWASKNGAPEPDLDNIIVAGHSSGCQAIIEIYRLLDYDISGIFLMDPVDGDPFEFSEKAIKEDDTFTKETPIYIMETGLGGERGFNIKLWPSCAPPAISANHFYPAFNSPKWHIRAVDFGHLDMVDDGARKGVTAIRFCVGAKDQDYDLYRRFIAGSIYSFISYIAGDDSYTPYLEDPELIPINTEIEFEK